MSGIRICGTGHAAGQRILTNEMLSGMVETSDEWIRTRTGIVRRHLLGEDTLAQHCAAAARAALARAGIEPAQIGACIVATVTPDTAIPAQACLLARDLGLPEDIVCFDLNAACTGFLTALHTMQGLLSQSARPYGLVVGAEAMSRVTDWTDRSTCVLFGDGAGAAVVHWSRSYRDGGAVLGCRGDGQALRLPGPGTQRPPYISMEGQRVFRFAVQTIPRCMTQVLEKTGLSMEQIDQVVFHQANARIIDHVARSCRIPPEKCCKNLSEYGNTSAASIPLLLSELQRSGWLGSGSRALAVGFGGGLTWGGMVLEFA